MATNDGDQLQNPDTAAAVVHSPWEPEADHSLPAVDSEGDPVSLRTGWAIRSGPTSD